MLLVTVSVGVGARTRPAIIKKNGTDLVSFAVKSKQMSASEVDVRTANRVSVFYDLISKGKFNEYLYKKTASDIRQNDNFKGFLFWIDGLKKINDESGMRAFFRTCDFEKFNKAGSKTEKLLSHQLKQYCYRRFLQVVPNGSKNNYLAKSESSQKFLKNNIEHFLSQKLEDEFSNYLERIPTNSANYATISEIIENFYIESDKNVPQRVMDYIEVSSDLTRHIQQRGVNHYQTYRVFYRELSYMTRKLNVLLDENDKSKDHVDAMVYEIINFYHRNVDFFPRKRALNRMLLNGKELMRHGYYKHSREFYRLVANNGSDSLRLEADFQNLWIDLSKNDYDSAVKYIQQAKLLERFDELSPKMKFWIAYAFEQSEQVDDSTKMYKKLIKNHPLTFYSTLASQQVEFKKNDKDSGEEWGFSKLLEMLPGMRFSKSGLRAEFVSSVKRLKAWVQVADKKLVEVESEDLLDLSSKDVFAESNQSETVPGLRLKENLGIMVTGILSERKDYLSTFSFLYSGLSQNNFTPSRQVLSALFPSPYLEAIKKFKTEVDPIVLLSLIRQESAFNPLAQSQVGATGLMQLMPATAQSIKKNVSVKDLRIPATNLRIGIKYFKYLYSKYDKNLVHTLIAYNAGETKLRQWKNKVFTNSSLLHTIESIPYMETRNYVKYIYRNIYFYKLLENNTVDTSRLDHIYDVPLIPQTMSL